jgi:threonine/homoserine/homoserine lactone efflux protein
MNWATYGSFLAFAVILILIPGPDFAVVTKNTLVGRRRRGLWSAAGVASSNAVQGLAAVAGLGAVVVRVQPLFEAIKWAGIGYLMFLGLQALRSAWRGRYTDAEGSGNGGDGKAWRGWRQGFLSNITNPKVLIFYLAVLPQFLGPRAPIALLLLYALSHAILSLVYLCIVVTGLSRTQALFKRRRVRRAMDGATGVAIIGFSAKLAAEHA